MTDIEIASKANKKIIDDVAKTLKLEKEDIHNYGRYIAKIDPTKSSNKDGKVILVTSINPTSAGEGKSTVTIGLADALKSLKKSSLVTLREPSLGPVFGLKGGATGGGMSQVVPMEDINLHFTGDFHAITTANNTVSALLFNHIHQGNELNIDLDKIIWKRAVDINDRSLRDITIGQGGKSNGIPAPDGFEITAASEIMSVLCLSKDLLDFRDKAAKILVAFSKDDKPIYLKDLRCAGSITVLMKDALRPNLVQTLENTPAIVHGGPFANIAHGCNSIIATNFARNNADYVITEAGFGADLGAEKFFNIKCRYANIKPSAVVIVVTLRALKLHGGCSQEDLNKESVEYIKQGICNLEKHIENIKSFNLPYVVSVNQFSTDTNQELDYILNWAKENDNNIELTTCHKEGSKGAINLAQNVIKLTNQKNNFTYTYDLNDSIEEKLNKVCKKIYGAKEVKFTKKALEDLEKINNNNWDKLPICIAKNQYSLSDDKSLVGRPKDFTITIKSLTPKLGAGFIICKTSNILTLPGLGKEPAALNIDIENGNIKGLF